MAEEAKVIFEVMKATGTTMAKVEAERAVVEVARTQEGAPSHLHLMQVGET